MESISDLYLVDTSVLSSAAPTLRIPAADLVDWMDGASDFLFLSAVTAAEIIGGIAKLEREGASRKAAILREWWATIDHLYGDRILPLDRVAARIAGELMDRARGAGYDPGFPDVAIAAIAETHGLTILTRNVRDFQPLGVPFLNPYEKLPPLPVGPGS